MRVLLLLLPLAGCSAPGKGAGGTSPTATITAPASGTNFLAGEQVALSGLVADGDAAPTELVVTWTLDAPAEVVTPDPVLADGTVTATWIPSAAGTYTLSLVAFDAGGLSGVDVVQVDVLANVAPEVTWTSPPDGATIGQDALPALRARVVDVDHDGAALTLVWSAAGQALGECDAPPGADGSAACAPDGLEAGEDVELCLDATDPLGAAGRACVTVDVTGCEDADGDGWDGCGGDADCDDGDAGVNPGAPERCDGLDQDCDGAADEDAVDPATWYTDADGDGFGQTDSAVTACEAPAGTVAVADDCDDGDAASHPGADESCTDTVDHNCDGSVAYADADADGWPACEECDDGNAAISPDGVEICDGADNDCDGTVDIGAADEATWYADADGDTYGDPTATLDGCAAATGFVADATDCDDGDAGVNPAALETCDDTDQDCDGAVDEDAVDPASWYRDADGDTHGDASVTATACDLPSGYVASDDDCDDGDATVYPGATELCDGLDGDCDGAVPAGEVDADSDGVLACESGYALEFDGGDLVEITGTGGEHLTGAHTLEAWVRTSTAMSDHGILGKSDCGSASGWALLVAGSTEARYGVGDGLSTTLSGGGALDDGAWHHVAGTWDGTTQVLYVDGVEVTSLAATYGSTNAIRWAIGAPGHSAACLASRFTGTIDEVAIFRTARTASEVAADASAALTGLESGLAGYWTFEEGSGQTTADLTGIGRDGTLGESSAAESSDPAWVEDGPF